MAENKFKDRLADYITVDQRIVAFYADHAEGSIQSEITHLTDKLVVVKAYAFRNPGDPNPGTGHSSMVIPGGTSFTRGSEVENAETSAWGRALAALGYLAKKGVATEDEIRNKQVDPSNAGERANGKGNDFTLATEDDRKRLLAKAKQLMGDKDGRAWVTQRTKDLAITEPENFHMHHFMMLMNELEKLENGEHVVPVEDSDIPW